MMGAQNELKITIHVVSSLDGLIANTDNSIGWFETGDHYENGVSISDADAAEFLKKIDCYLMGSRTYEHALELSKNYGWAYGDKPTIVLSKRKLPVERESVEIYPGDLKALVNDKLRPNYKTVWVVGGAELAQDFLRHKLADEIRQSIMPIILGDGLRLFHHSLPEQALHLHKVTAYKTGMVELHYEVKK